jgi:VCBS repeat-containing protein
MANLPPTLSATATNPTFTEGDLLPVALFTSPIDASTVEAGQTFTGMWLRIANIRDWGNELLIFDDTVIQLGGPDPISTAVNHLDVQLVTIDNDSVLLQVSGGSMGIAELQALIDTIQYVNLNPDPTPGQRVFALEGLQDSGPSGGLDENTSDTAIASTIEVVAINDPPTLTATAVNPTFRPGGSQVDVFATPIASTVEANQTFFSMSFTVSNVVDGDDEVISFGGMNIKPFERVPIIGFNELTVRMVGTTLIVSFHNEHMSVERLEDLIDNIGYTHLGANPTVDDRVFTIAQLIDRDGNEFAQVQNLVSSTVHVNGVAANTAPVANDDANTLTEDVAPATPATGNVFANDTDADGDSLVVTNAGLHVTLRGSLTLNQDGSYSYLLNNSAPLVNELKAGETTTDTFAYSISDNNGGTDDAELVITITGTNDAPTGTTLLNAKVAENSASGTVVGIFVAADPDAGDDWTFTLVTGSGSDDNALFQIVGNQIHVAPGALLDFEQDTSHSVRVRTMDAGGLFVEKAFAISVTNQNEASVAEDDTDAITQGVAPNPVSGNVLANDTDVDDDSLNVTTTGTFALTYGTLLLSANGSYSYTLDNSKAAVQGLTAGEAVTDGFTYTISDGKGGTDSADLTITITGTNDAPELSGDKVITVAEGGEVVITTADLSAIDPDNTSAQLAFTVTGTSHGTVQVSGVAAAAFTQDDIVNNRLTFLHDGDEADGGFSLSLTDGGDAPVTATVTAAVNPHVNDAPTAGNVTLPAITVNSGARIITQAQLLAGASDLDGSPLTVTDLQVVQGFGSLVESGSGTWTYTPKVNDDSEVVFVFTVADGALSANGQAKLDITSAQSAPEIGSPGDDTFTAASGNATYHGLGGADTIIFGFKLTDASFTFSGNAVIVDGPSSRTVLTGFEVFNFTDGTVHNDDGSPLIDDLFYYSKYHDVWNAQVDADLHYNAAGWHENRDPNAFFDTSLYLSAYPDAAATGNNPLDHFDTIGWKEARVPSHSFDPRQYLAANQDVAAAKVDPLRHFLGAGASEGRQPFDAAKLIASSGFDFVYYLQHNGDVAAAGVDPLWHFQNIGWKEGRDPNALFDTSGYLAAYTDVAAANINPLDHYNASGWHEGRDPSVNFDTTSYLAASPDVAAAHINPLMHFLYIGQDEGRSPFADGTWG